MQGIDAIAQSKKGPINVGSLHHPLSSVVRLGTSLRASQVD